jgi:hypothetical protein
MEEFTPKAVGAGYALPRCLAPLKDVRDDLLVITGLRNDGALRGTGDSHEKGRVCFATAVPSPSGLSAGGPSLDQVAAQKLGSATKFPSLVVSPNNGAGGSSANTSWTDVDRPVPYVTRPGVLFSKLFAGGAAPGAGAAELATVRSRRKSVLDFVKQDAARLDGRLGAGDKLRVKAHLEAVRDIERRIELENKAAAAAATAPVAACKPAAAPPPDAKGDDPWQYDHLGAPVERYTLLEDLLVVALQCDLTRYGAIKLGIDVQKWIHETYKDTRGHHDISHDNGATEIHVGYTAYQMGFLARLMGKLKAIKEGDKTLLHNTLIYASSEVSHGGAHNYTNMPVLVAGQGGGAIKSGRHVNLMPFLTPGRFSGVQNEEWTDVGRLFLTLLGAAGVTGVGRWGDATAPLDLGA